MSEREGKIRRERGREIKYRERRRERKTESRTQREREI